ncbi:MAG: hypothetical protein ND866_18685 [Pyrinomonadaceae bacterium]|nr:hypothetical protein [Pyrinomonadaceae bacterium]
MPLLLLKAGGKFRIYAWGNENRCKTVEFLEKLQVDSNSDAIRLLNLIGRTADHGPPNNEQHSRLLVDGIYEFKLPTRRDCFGSMMKIASSFALTAFQVRRAEARRREKK